MQRTTDISYNASLIVSHVHNQDSLSVMWHILRPQFITIFSYLSSKYSWSTAVGCFFTWLWNSFNPHIKLLMLLFVLQAFIISYSWYSNCSINSCLISTTGGKHEKGVWIRLADIIYVWVIQPAGKNGLKSWPLSAECWAMVAGTMTTTEPGEGEKETERKWWGERWAQKKKSRQEKGWKKSKT